jgi:hypothetical protein
MYIDEKIGDKVKAFEVSLTWNNPDGTEVYIEMLMLLKMKISMIHLNKLNQTN